MKHQTKSYFVHHIYSRAFITNSIELSSKWNNYLVVAGAVAVPGAFGPKLNGGAAAALVVWAPYGGALEPNKIPPVEVAVGANVAVGAGAGATAAVGVPKPPNGVVCWVGAWPPNGVFCWVCAGCIAPKPVLAVVCGDPNENPDIFFTIFSNKIHLKSTMTAFQYTQ